MLKQNGLSTYTHPIHSRTYSHVTTWPLTFFTQKYSVLPPGIPLCGTHSATHLYVNPFSDDHIAGNS